MCSFAETDTCCCVCMVHVNVMGTTAIILASLHLAFEYIAYSLEWEITTSFFFVLKSIRHTIRKCADCTGKNSKPSQVSCKLRRVFSGLKLSLKNMTPNLFSYSFFDAREEYRRRAGSASQLSVRLLMLLSGAAATGAVSSRRQAR